MECIIVSTDGKKEMRNLNSLAKLQEAVGGMIEHTIIGVEGKGMDVYVNEEGLMMALPLNQWGANHGVSLLGPIVVIGPADVDGNETDVTDEQIKLVMGENVE